MHMNGLCGFPSNFGKKRFLAILSILGTALFSLAGCGSGLKFGDIDAVNDATELAVDCRTEEALAAVDRAEQGGGFGASMGELQRVAILRDAERMDEAEAAMVDWEKRWSADAEKAAEAKEAVVETVDRMRAERQKRTGSRMCK